MFFRISWKLQKGRESRPANVRRFVDEPAWRVDAEIESGQFYKF